MSRIIQPVGDKIIIPSHKMWMGMEDRMPPRILYPRLSKKGILTPGSSLGSASPSGAVNGLIGNATASTNYAIGHNMKISEFTTTTAGIIKYMRIKLNALQATDTINLAIYSYNGDRDGTLIQKGTAVPGQGAGVIVYKVTLDADVTLVAATQYYLAYMFTGTFADVEIYYETGHTGNDVSSTDSFSSNFPASFDVGDFSVWSSDSELYIYANNTA